MHTCQICGNQTDNISYVAKEMMFGLEDSFRYFQCGACQCLQLADVPDEMERYYPDDYYSFRTVKDNSVVGSHVRTLRNRYSLTGKGVIGKVVNARYPNIALRALRQGSIPTGSRILDVGSGDGKTLLELRSLGYRKLMGIDPFIDSDIRYENGPEIKKQSIFEVTGEWDLIMFHHALEHMPMQRETLHKCASLLPEGGKCLIRIPTVSSYAWEHYRANWVQLDAPRHLFLHSNESIAWLAKEAGLVVDAIVDDSTEFQFTESELRVRGFSMMGPHSYQAQHQGPAFSSKQIQAYRRHADQLNRQGKGDQSVYWLRKPEKHEWPAAK